MNASGSAGAGGQQAGDILFECPQCGKSLEIDARGAGYIIVCPDCKTEIQVPGWQADQETAGERPDGEEVEQVQLEQILEQLENKIVRLDHQQQLDDQCFKRIGDEIVLIQSALDRITEIVETRNAKS